MTTVNNNSYLDNISWGKEQPQPKSENKNQLTQEDFFALMTQQLAFQDPMNPVSNDQMIAQMASFSTIEGITQMTQQMGSLADSMASSQSLQAAGLVGRTVTIPSNVGYHDGEGAMSGVVIAGEGAQNLKVRIEDENGQLIKTIPLEDTRGNIAFSWDGTNEQGEPMPAGNYVIKAEGRAGGEPVEMPVGVHANVDSVSLGNSGLGVVLNVRGLGGVKLTDVLEVAQS